MSMTLKYRLALAAFTMVALACPGAAAADRDERLEVAIDRAQVLKIVRRAETVIIGNPSIVDVTVHDSQTLVLTGRSYGITNLVVLDGNGEAIIDAPVSVTSSEEGTVRVYRQAERVTYACLPQCEPTVTIGDSQRAFTSAATQYGTRQSMATGQATTEK